MKLLTVHCTVYNMCIVFRANFSRLVLGAFSSKFLEKMFRCITCLESNLTIDVGSRTLTMLENCSLVGAAVPFEVQLGKGLFRCPYRSTPIKLKV